LDLRVWLFPSILSNYKIKDTQEVKNHHCEETLKIKLNEMVFYGYHGVHAEERALGQRFIVSVTFITIPP
jgi:hypothetical protein